MPSTIESKMVHRIYPANSETVINLQDGSFIDPVVTRRWVEAALIAGDFPWLNMGGKSGYVGLYDDLEERAYTAAQEKIDSADDIEAGEVIVDVKGVFDDTPEAIALTSFMGFNSYDTAEEARQAEIKFLQEQAFATYRIADEMNQTSEGLRRLQDARIALDVAQKEFDQAKTAL